MLLTVQADQAFEPSGDPDTSSGAGPRHHVVVWLFTNRYRQFEFTSLHHTVHRVLHFLENRSKSASVRAICDCAWTQRTQSASACVGCFSNSQKYFFNAKYNRKSCISLKPSSLGRSSSKSQNSEGFNFNQSCKESTDFLLDALNDSVSLALCSFL